MTKQKYKEILNLEVQNGWKPLKGVQGPPPNLKMSREELLKTDLLKMSKEQEQILDNIKKDHEINGPRYRKFLIGLYVIALIGLYMFYKHSPAFDSEEKSILFTFPNSLERLRASVEVIKRYSDGNFAYVLSLYIYLYLSLQSLGIPGCGLLSIISGALFPFWLALSVVSVCATCGASICYLLSKYVLRGFVVGYQGQRVASFAAKINTYRDHLIFYFVSLRFSPIFPNLFVNLASPIVGVPLYIFFFGTLVGLIPLNILHIKTGATLELVSEFGVKTADFGYLMLISLLVLIPTYFNKRKRKRL